MRTVLIVDDEPNYRKHMARILTRYGFEVQMAGTAQEAIAIGIRMRPTVLATDWMLHDAVHGLDVARALQTIQPQMQTVLITAYDATDLRHQVEQAPGCSYLTKPFRLEDLVQAVETAEKTLPACGLLPPVAAVEIDAKGHILYANPAAQTCLTRTQADAQPDALQDVMRWTSRLQAGAVSQWRQVRLHGPHGEAAVWWVRMRHDPKMSTQLLVMVPGEEADYRLYDPDLGRLLNLPVEVEMDWPFPAPALIIDADERWRHIASQQLGRIGGVCQTTGTWEEGLGLLARHVSLSVVIVAAHADGSIDDRVAELCAYRPAVQVVGTSHLEDDRHEFASMGITHFLRKPWRADDLVAQLMDVDKDRPSHGHWPRPCMHMTKSGEQLCQGPRYVNRLGSPRMNSKP